MQDHYETLQVHPKADQETIQAAYERMRERYSAEKLADAAPELTEMARQKRDAIEHAYAVLGDETRRAAYDEERRQLAPDPAAHPANPDDLIDYRPLPPAQRQERSRSFDAYPTRSSDAAAQPQRGRSPQRKPRFPAWALPAGIVGVMTFVIVLGALLLTDGGRPRYADAGGDGAANTANTSDESSVPTDHEQEMADVLAQYDAQVTNARQVAERLPDNVDAWITLGNALYDSVQIVREIDPTGPMYQERLPRWLEASEAYDRAIALGAGATVRSDMGVSLCYYGVGTDDQNYVEEGIRNTRAALLERSRNGRTLLNHGICLVSQQPAEVAEAVELWQQVLELPAAEVGVTQQAELLLQEYGAASGGS